MDTSSTPGQRLNRPRVVRFSDQDLSHIAQRMRQVGQTNFSKFVRDSLTNSSIRIVHSVEVPRSLMNQISAIGNNINQIAHHANTLRAVDRQMVFEALELVKEIRSLLEHELGESLGYRQNPHDTRESTPNTGQDSRSTED